MKIEIDFDKKFHDDAWKMLWQAKKSGAPFPLEETEKYLYAFFSSLRRAGLMDNGYLDGSKKMGNSEMENHGYYLEMQNSYDMWLKHCGWIRGGALVKVLLYH